MALVGDEEIENRLIVVIDLFGLGDQQTERQPFFIVGLFKLLVERGLLYVAVLLGNNACCYHPLLSPARR